MWKENKKINLVDPGLGHLGFQAHEPETGEVSPEGLVDGITIDKIIKDYSIDFVDLLKIDIEGSEKEVFEDISDWESIVGVIMIEMHDRIKAGCTTQVYDSTPQFGNLWEI